MKRCFSNCLTLQARNYFLKIAESTGIWRGKPFCFEELLVMCFSYDTMYLDNIFSQTNRFGWERLLSLIPSVCLSVRLLTFEVQLFVLGILVRRLCPRALKLYTVNEYILQMWNVEFTIWSAKHLLKWRGSELRRIWDMSGYLYNTLSATIGMTPLSWGSETPHSDSIHIVDVQRWCFSLIDQKLLKWRGSKLRRIWDISGYLYSTLSATLWYEAFVLWFWNSTKWQNTMLRFEIWDVQCWDFSLIDHERPKLQGSELRQIWDILGYLHRTERLWLPISWSFEDYVVWTNK